MPGFNGLDTPRTNVGDATYLHPEPEFDITQEPSFQSPGKDNNNLLQQMRNGKSNGVNLRTPRASRLPLGNKLNLPAGIGGAEFTPLLKSATRNGARRRGKENTTNGHKTPRTGRVDEDMDMTNIPVESSLYGPSRASNSSYLNGTPLPQVDNDSDASTPIVLQPRRDAAKGPLADGHQLSLREQENVIDRIEKENFGLKLKIHFLEDALRKAGPGFSEAALKENTELKVDKVTMQRELHKFKKQLSGAEKDLEAYQQQISEVQEKAKKKYANEDQKNEIDKLRQLLGDKEAHIEDLQRQLDDGNKDTDKIDRLQDDIGDLEADLREKDRLIDDHEEEIDGLKTRAEDAEEKWKSAEEQIAELREKAKSSEELDEARDTIEELEASARRLEQQLDDKKAELEQALSEKNRAEGDLEELQDELSNKSMVTKGLSRQTDEKLSRLQAELDKSQEKYASLEQQTADKEKMMNDIKAKAKKLLNDRDSWETEKRALTSKLDGVQKDLSQRTDEKNLLQLRHDALGDESASLQRDVSQLQKQIEDLEDSLDQEKAHALQIEQDVRSQYKAEVDRLNDEISDLQADVREKENLYDNDSDKWETEKHQLESDRDRAEERAAGLQRTIDKLREVEGSLSTKESRLQEALNSEADRHRSEEAVLSRQLDELRQDLEARQSSLTELRNEVSAVRDELRQSQLDSQSQVAKIEELEDEVAVLQAALDEDDEQAGLDLENAKQECEGLRRQLRELQDDANDARATSSASQQASETITRLQEQLSDANSQLSKVRREKQGLQEQLANNNIELQSLRASLAETKAEREEVEDQLQRLQAQDNDTFRLDQERIDLRTAKVKLDSEVRRLRDENRALGAERESLERALEDEIEKAAVEEERLGQEVVQLQSKLRQSSGSESQELAAARRTIRDLERKLDDYEAQIAAQSIFPQAGAEGNSELSHMRRDLSSARQKELELLQREAGHKDAVRGLKRQIADLERKLHEAEMTRLVASSSPNASGSGAGSARKQEVAELRHQLAAAHQALHDMKKQLREAQRAAASKSAAGQDQAASEELLAELDDMEEQKLALEQELADAQRLAAEAKLGHERAVRKLEHQITKLEQQQRHSRPDKDHDNAAAAAEEDASERKELRRMLRASQKEVKALESDVRQQAAMMATHEAAQAALRQKLERARAESAGHRARAQKLQADCARLEASAKGALQWIQTHNDDLHQNNHHSNGKEAAAEASNVVAYGAAKEMALRGRTSITLGRHNGRNIVIDVVDQKDHEAVIRAADAAARRHAQEIRGLAVQMQWMQARWEREARLRSDGAFAKRFVELRLSLAEACNKADLRVLAQIHQQLGIQSPDSLLSASRSRTDNNSNRNKTNANDKKSATLFRAPPPSAARRHLHAFAVAVRAVARMRIAARAWRGHERTRLRLADAWEEAKRREPVRRWDGGAVGGGGGGGRGGGDDGEGGGGVDSGDDEEGGGGGGEEEEGMGMGMDGFDDDCMEMRV